MSERLSMDVDIVCVGFGPATAGFLTTVSKASDLPPLQIVCYERAEDIGFGVSGVVSSMTSTGAELRFEMGVMILLTAVSVGVAAIVFKRRNV